MCSRDGDGSVIAHSMMSSHLSLPLTSGTSHASPEHGKILTLTGVPEYVEKGLSIGVWIKGERPALLINLAASKAEGADLDSQFFNLVTIVR